MGKSRSDELERIAEEFEKYEDFLDSQITETKKKINISI